MTAAVLVLNVTYEPLPEMVSINRAVCMVVSGDADIIKAVEGKYFRSQSLSIPAPSVVKLRFYVKVPYRRRRITVTSRNVRIRDNHVCAYCGQHADTYDHVVPTSRGGRNTWENVVAACKKCNSKKDNSLLDELGWTLLYKPCAPSGKAWLVVGMAERQHHEEFFPEHM